MKAFCSMYRSIFVQMEITLTFSDWNISCLASCSISNSHSHTKQGKQSSILWQGWAKLNSFTYLLKYRFAVKESGVFLTRFPTTYQECYNSKTLYTNVISLYTHHLISCLVKPSPTFSFTNFCYIFCLTHRNPFYEFMNFFSWNCSHSA